MAATNVKDFYQILQELVAQLKDGHTFIIPPISELLTQERPAFNLQMIENKIIITQVGDSEELMKNDIIPGLEVEKIDNQPAKEYLNKNFIRFYKGNTKHGGEAYGLNLFLNGVYALKV